MGKIARVMSTFIISLYLSTAFGATTMTSLTNKQHYVIPIAAFTANGDLPRLKIALQEGLENGLNINEAKEVIVQMYAYAGFPRSLNALSTLMQLIAEREKQGLFDEIGPQATPFPKDKNSLDLGTEIQTYLVGAPVAGGVMAFSSEIDQFLKSHLFGDIFGRDTLDYQTREVATIAALSSISGVEGQLQSHVHIAMNIGLTSTQIKNIAVTLRQKVGESEACMVEHALNHVDK